MSGMCRAALLLALLVGPAIPFLDKAYHVDDRLMLRGAESVIRNPADPLGGTFDYAGRVMLLRDLATNPPGISYVLAPLVTWTDASEPWLHAAMLLFPIGLGAAILSLGARFTRHPFSAAAFVLWSPAVIAGLNVMQDVPAAALATGAVAAFVAGIDRKRTALAALGAGLLGFAILTKYSSAAVIPVLALYAILRGVPRQALWTALPLAALGAWGLFSLAAYGQPHFLAVSQRSYGAGVAWKVNLAALTTIVGAACWLGPALLAAAARQRDALLLRAALSLVVAAWVLDATVGAGLDAQRALWSAAGALVLGVAIATGARSTAAWLRDHARNEGADAFLLLSWLGTILLFGVVFTPFPAMRHLVPALPPLVLLGVRVLEESGALVMPRGRLLLAALLAAQLMGAELVAWADADHADVYRDFAKRMREQASAAPGRVWFAGTWGWAYYAERAGMRQLHGLDPQRPRPGDRVVWTDGVPVGLFLPTPAALGVGLREIETRAYAPRLPIRTLGARLGAGFYAMAGGTAEGDPPAVPYRWVGLGVPLERFSGYEVVAGSPNAPPGRP
jgi:hypothetical protein